jgi:hypothetical protein
LIKSVNKRKNIYKLIKNNKMKKIETFEELKTFSNWDYFLYEWNIAKTKMEGTVSITKEWFVFKSWENKTIIKNEIDFENINWTIFKNSFLEVKKNLLEWFEHSSTDIQFESILNAINLISKLDINRTEFLIYQRDFLLNFFEDEIKEEEASFSN